MALLRLERRDRGYCRLPCNLVAAGTRLAPLFATTPGTLTEIDGRGPEADALAGAELPADPTSWPATLNRPLPVPAARDEDDVLEIVWVLLEIL